MSERSLIQLLGEVATAKNILDAGLLLAPEKKLVERQFRKAVLDLLTELVKESNAKTE